MPQNQTLQTKRLKRHTNSVIIHFDYDCFYASVFENENPALRSLPLAVQQKQIVVTCNYEARRRGLHKLQLIKDAKRICPEVVIVLGEDLTRFRDASKELYLFLRSFSWSHKVERLGFDEVFMDVSDIVDYNVALLNPNDLSNSFFCLSKNDPTTGFAYDASQVAGNAFPEASIVDDATSDALRLRLHLGSHLAQFIREALRTQKGYTCTAGVSVNKELSKLIGNLHKPHNQTTLLPPYETDGTGSDSVTAFLDSLEIGKIPGIGSRLARKLRALVSQRLPKHDQGQVQDSAEERVLVSQVRAYPGMGPDLLEQTLGGPGTPHGIGTRTWDLLNGCDDTEVGQARDVPRQISIEDTYGRLDSHGPIVKELRRLATSLVKRMRVDLITDEEDEGLVGPASDDPVLDNIGRRWLAFPKTIRLSTCLRSASGDRSARISRSAPMPNFIFNNKDDLTSLSDRLAAEVLVPLFRKLHPEKGYNVCLINIAATNIADAASEKGGPGRDIAKMFRRQDGVLKQWKVDEAEEGHLHVTKEDAEDNAEVVEYSMERKIEAQNRTGSEDLPTTSQEEYVDNEGHWESEDDSMLDDDIFRCEQCGATMPVFAMAAHYRWHAGHSN